MSRGRGSFSAPARSYVWGLHARAGGVRLPRGRQDDVHTGARPAHRARLRGVRERVRPGGHRRQGPLPDRRTLCLGVHRELHLLLGQTGLRGVRAHHSQHARPRVPGRGAHGRRAALQRAGQRRPGELRAHLAARAARDRGRGRLGAPARALFGHLPRPGCHGAGGGALQGAARGAGPGCGRAGVGGREEPGGPGRGCAVRPAARRVLLGAARARPGPGALCGATGRGARRGRVREPVSGGSFAAYGESPAVVFGRAGSGGLRRGRARQGPAALWRSVAALRRR